MKIIEKANLTMENALFGTKTFRANKTKVSNFDSEVVTDEWTENKKYEVTPTKDFISKMNITVNVDLSPKKGDVLLMDLNGDGTNEKYVILKVNENSVEVIGRKNVDSGGTVFSNSNNVYAGSEVDTLLNTTYYSTLTEGAKAAIVDKTFRQDSWYKSDAGNPDYAATYTFLETVDTYQMSLGSSTYGSEITRHIYTISVQDLIDYFEVTPQMTYENTTLTGENISQLYKTGGALIYLRSASASAESKIATIDDRYGVLREDLVNGLGNVYPAFQIDLSKIEWSKDNA